MFREFLGPRARLSYPALPLFVRRPFLPATDVFTRGDDMVVRMELAGIDPEKDVSVTLDEGDLVIRGERRRSEEITVPKAAKSEQPPKAKRIPIKTTKPRRDRADATRVRKAQIVAEGHRGL